MKRRITTILALSLLLSLVLWAAPHTTRARVPALSPLAMAGCASLGFARTDYATGTGPRSVAAGDFNGDGKLDLAVANGQTDNVSVFLGDGLVGFGAPTYFAAGNGPVSITVGDFNGDGKLDLATANLNVTSVSVLIGNGLGGFTTTDYFAGDGPISIVTGDFNNDGKLDLATAVINEFNIYSVSVLLGDGTGRFGAPIRVPAGYRCNGVGAGDFNGDGKLDLVSVDAGGGDIVSVLLGDGMGGFGAPTNFPVGVFPAFVAVNDLNGDGKLDLVTANLTSNNVSVLLGDGLGGFGAATSFATGDGARSVTVGDFNGDGKLDLAVPNRRADNVSVLFGNGVGSFGAPANFALGDFPESVAVGDFDRNGKLDLAATNHDSNNISLMLNACTATQPPTITSVVAFKRVEGSLVARFQIATAGDSEDAANTLQVAINSDGVNYGNTVGLNGVTVALTDGNAGANGTNPDATGKIFADVIAACGATTAGFTLKVSNSGHLIATTVFIVTVNPNTPPTLSYNNASTTADAALAINPATGPADNGSVESFAVQSVTPSPAPATLTVNSSGVVSVLNNIPAGAYTVTIRATDNCGGATGMTDASFTLTVACVNTLTVNDLGDTPDAAPGDGVCADSAGKCTLRAALAEANALAACAPLTINFSVTGTINLTSALPEIMTSLTINGPGATLLNVHRATSNGYRIFFVSYSGLEIAISGLTISNGLGHFFGGGILSYSNLRLTDCAVIGNQAVGTNSMGGGVFMQSVNGVFTGCTFSGNTAILQGGAINFQGENSNTLQLINCTISGNTATSGGFGNGILNISGSGSSTLELTNCTIANNTSPAGTGSGILTGGSIGSVVTTFLRNTIIANNTGQNLLAGSSGVVTSLGYNLTDDGGGGWLTAAGDKRNTTPLLGALADNGGPTQTHALLPSSPALNAGNNCVLTNNCASRNLGFNLTTDQRGAGFARGVVAVDIGAHEVQAGVADHLAFIQQPTNAVVNTAFAPAVTVRVLDVLNNVVTTGATTINLSFANNPGGATLGGTTSLTTVNGEASFSTLSANKPGTGYTLAAAATGLVGASSSSFNITCPALTVTPGTNPVVPASTTSASLPYTVSGSADQYSLDYDATANAAGFADVTNAALGGSPLTLTIPATAAAGATYHATLTVRSSPTGCASSAAAFTVTVACPTLFTVNDLGDTPDAVPGNGACADGAGKCTLRAAIQEANALPTCAPLTISFNGTGTISLATALPDIAVSLTLNGPGANRLVVQRSSADGTPDFRIFNISLRTLNIALSGLTISHGKALGGFGGGGILSQSNLTLTDCAFTGNEASGSFGGGGVSLVFADGVFTGCTFSGNMGGNQGGGIQFEGSGGHTLRLSNCTISGNSAGGAGMGGGIFHYSFGDSVLEVTNCTIANNTSANTSAAANGGGIFTRNLISSGTVTTRLRNTLLAGNTAPTLRLLASSGGVSDLTSLGHNLTDDDGGGLLNQPTDKLNTNPLLAACVNYGGTTPTCALLPGSPAINAGTVTDAPATDQRGSGRVGAVDIGAFESQGFTLSIASGNGQSAAVNSNFAQPLQVYVIASGIEPTGGGKITFTSPGSGASASVEGSPVTIPFGDAATSGTVTANGIVGSYNVVASANGAASGVSFSLMNTCQTITVTTPAVITGTAGASFNQTFAQSGGVGMTTFSTTSALPPGLMLSSAGVLSGTPTQMGTFPLVVKATDTNNCMGASATYTLAIGCPTISINPISASQPTDLAGQAGVAYTQTITASPGGTSYVYAVTVGSLPAGITLNPTSGIISGTTNLVGAFNFTLTATGWGGCTSSRQYRLNIGCPTIALTGLPGGTASVTYNQTIAATPAGGSYNFAVTSGSLPPGLSLNTGGALMGIPTAAGTFSFTIKATGFDICTQTQNYAMTIACPTITLSALPNGTFGVLYGQTLTASPSGGNYSFAVTSGLLPAGLTLNSNGSFSGAPAQSGVFNFRVTATGFSGGFGSCSGFADYVLLVNCSAVTVNPSSLPGGTLGTTYNQSLSASPDGTYSYSVSSGALPPGLMLNAATGAISGTLSQAGSFNFRITASGGCSGTRDYTISVSCQAITLPSLASATAGLSYAGSVVASPASAYTYSLTAGNLPSGLTLNPSTGALTGSPTITGTYNFTVKAQAASGCSGSQSYALAVACPTIALSSLAAPTLNSPYNQTVIASPPGGSYSFAITGTLPNGLSLNSATGAITGTPATAGTFNFTITATGFGNCAGGQNYSGTIAGSSCPTITLADLPGGQPGQLYSQSAAASPSGGYSYAVTSGSLPPGLTLYGSFGLINGYPTTADSYSFTITATDVNNCTGSKQYSVTIGGAAVQSLVFGDFDGDGKADLSVWRGQSGDWMTVASGNGQLKTEAWGSTAAPYFDVMTPGDFDGDGKMDLAVFRRTNGQWLIKGSKDGAVTTKVWGQGTDIPVAGDYDGDGKTDLAVWRGAETNWYILRSSDGQTQTVSWGTSRAPYRDVPVAADFDGDGKTDVAVFRQANGHWYIQLSSDGSTLDKAWGLGTDVPVAADYDGDGKADIAVWRGAETNWYILRSSDGAVQSVSWGTASLGDVPVPGDYDGDGKADAAVWREMDGHWYIKSSRDDKTLTLHHGQPGDTPVTRKQK